jgi:hypothetical protein
VKFNSYDELIAFLNGKTLSSLDFEIKDVQPTDPATPAEVCPGGCDVELAPAVLVAEGSVSVIFTSFSDNPEMLFEVANESVLVVDEFNSIPNACSTTKLLLKDREVTIGICESADGDAYARFNVTVNGKSYSGKTFKIVSDSTKYKNTISLDD